MGYLIVAGSIVSLIGLAGLIWCILIALRARREGIAGDALRSRLQKVVALNAGALAISALGLMMVIVGIMLS